MQNSLSANKIELQTKIPQIRIVSANDASSSEEGQTAPLDNTMALMSQRADFEIHKQDTNQVEGMEVAPPQVKDGKGSSLTQNRNGSVVSDSKLTQHYSQMWDNEDDRQRVMARFRSFDMTGMTQYNSYNQRSPSQISKQPPVNGNADGMTPRAAATKGKDKDNRQQVVNIITKLPFIANTPGISPSDTLVPSMDTNQQLAQGNAMFTLQQQKNFVKHNTYNVAGNSQLIPTGKQLLNRDSPQRGVLVPVTEASSYLDRQQMTQAFAGALSPQQQQQLMMEAHTPGNAAFHSPHDQSFVSFQLASSDQNLAKSFLPETTNNASPTNQSLKYERPNEKFFRQAQLGLKQGIEIKMENQYDLRNYRLDNKKLPVGLPGEKKAKFYEKTFEEREKIDQRKLDKYVEKIYGNEGNLQVALNATYNQKVPRADDKHEGLKKSPSNFDQVKQLVMQSAHDQNAHSQRLKPAAETIKETRFETPKGTRDYYSVQQILAGAKTEIDSLNLKENPFVGAQSNPKFPGRIMVGMESVQQLVPYKGSQTARSFAVAQQSYGRNYATSEANTSHLPREVANFLDKKQGMKSRPSRLQTLSATVRQPPRKFVDSSITNKRIRQFSMFPRASKIVADTKKFEQMSDNITLKNFSKEMAEQMQGKQSVTCLTGTAQQAALLSRYEEFKMNDRVNPFTVEEYYFLRNNLPTMAVADRPRNQTLGTLESIQSLGGLNTSKQMRKSMREFAKDNDVIHVTIDRQSLAQLTKLSERDIKRDEKVKLVTNRNSSGSKGRTDSKGDPLGQLEENANIKTMYGTFNKEPGVPDQKRITVNDAVFDQLKSGGQTTTDGRLDTASQGLSPQSAIFNGEEASRSGVLAGNQPIVFGVTATNEAFGQKSTLALVDPQDNTEQLFDNLNKTQPAPQVSNANNVFSSQQRTSRFGKKDRSEQKSRLTDSQKSPGSKKTQKKLQASRPSKIKILVDDEQKVLTKLKHMESVDQKSQDMTEENDTNSVDRVNEAIAQNDRSPSSTSGRAAIFSKIKPQSNYQIESLHSMQKSEQGFKNSRNGSNEGKIQQIMMATGGSNMPASTLIGVAEQSIKSISLPETEQLGTATLGLQKEDTIYLQEPDSSQLHANEPKTADPTSNSHLIVRGNAEESESVVLPSFINQQEFNGARSSTQQPMDAVDQLNDQLNQMPNVLVNVDSTGLKSGGSHSDDKVNQPLTAEDREAAQSAIMEASRGRTGPETANFIRIDGQTTEEQQSVLKQQSAMDSTMRDKELRGTKVSIKIGDRSVPLSEFSEEEIDELERFHRMSLPSKRQYISLMSNPKSGFKTPGMIMDDLIESRITELDEKYQGINFGQAITHQTFEPFVPKKLTEEENERELRKWKLRQIILKQYQFVEREQRFDNNLKKFKDNKQRIHNFRKLAVQGYDKNVSMEKEAQLLNENGSQLLFLDGKGNIHSSSSKQLQEIFFPNRAELSSSKGLDLRNEIEYKVRQLLGRTELSEIAGTAKVLVEISDDSAKQQGIAQAAPGQSNRSGDGGENVQQLAKSPSGFQTSKILLSPRLTNKTKLLKQVKST